MLYSATSYERVLTVCPMWGKINIAGRTFCTESQKLPRFRNLWRDVEAVVAVTVKYVRAIMVLKFHPFYFLPIFINLLTARPCAAINPLLHSVDFHPEYAAWTFSSWHIIFQSFRQNLDITCSFYFFSPTQPEKQLQLENLTIRLLDEFCSIALFDK